VILSIGGIPLIYLGDEVATLNDYGYRNDPAKSDDSRWVHRPAADWEKIDRRHDTMTVEGQVYARLRQLIETRKKTPAFAGGVTEIIDTGNPQVFGYVRQHADHHRDEGVSERVLVLANFSEGEQHIAANDLRVHGLSYALTDLVSGTRVTSDEELVLEPYRFVWLRAG
jgi:glycosidase